MSHPAGRPRARSQPPAFEPLEERRLLSSLPAPVFGNGGSVVTAILGPVGNAAARMVQQPDGKLIILETDGGYSGGPSTDLLRYLPDGTLDTSFGTGGEVVTGISGSDLALEGDGKIVVAGVDGKEDFAVARFNVDGSPDVGFGNGGLVTTDFGASNGYVPPDSGVTVAVAAVALQSDNKIVVVGNSGGFNFGTQLDMARYNADGSLDATFGTGGKVEAPDPHANPSFGADAVAIQPDGKILVAGGAYLVVQPPPGVLRATFSIIDLALERFNPDGTLDTSFGSGGKVFPGPAVSQPTNVQFGALAGIQADGTIVLVGDSYQDGAVYGLVLRRYNPDGSLATNNTVTFPGQQTYINAAALASDGSIVVGGSLYTVANIYAQDPPSINPGDFAWARFHADGSLDTSIGNGGLVTTVVGSSHLATIHSIGVTSSGQVVAAGEAFDGHTQDVALARYNADGTLDTSFGAGGTLLTDAQGPTPVSANLLTVQPDGKLVVAGLDWGGQRAFALARYNPDGSLDTGFGTRGQVLTIVDQPSTELRLTSIVVQSDGKILLVGSAALLTPDDHTVLVLARYNADGSLDTTFGTGGLVFTNIFAGPVTLDLHDGVLLQPDGKILVAANTDLVRFNADGSLDTTFGNNGHVPGPWASVSVSALADDANGRIGAVRTTALVFAALVPDAAHNNQPELAVARYNADGSLDASFGTGGIVLTAIAMDHDLHITVQPDGKILLTGGVVDADSIGHLVLVRLNGTGALDTGFGNNGVVVSVFVDTGMQYVSDVALDSQGKIVVAGEFNPVFGNNLPPPTFRLAQAVLVRFNPDGSLDTSFGTGGRIIHPSDHLASIGGLVLQPDGHLLLAGTDPSGNLGKFALVQIAATDLGIGDPPGRFIIRVYRDLLARDPEPAGLTYWVGLMNQSVSRDAIVRGIEASLEYRTDVVEHLYARLLGRAADPFGLAAFVSVLGKGGSVETVEESILASPEYFQRAGGTTLGFLTALYHDMLDRGLDPVALALGRVNFTTVAARAAEAAVVVRSPEAAQDTVQAFYRTYLRRAADPAGLNAFTSDLNQGIEDAAIVAAILGSAEYLQSP